jgi:hypothetical protein
VAVTEDEGSPGQDIIDVLVAVHVPQPGAEAILKIERNWKLGAERTADSSDQ